MAVTYSKFREDSTTFPTDSASTFTGGENIPAGPLEAIVLKFNATIATGGILADFPNVISSLRLTLNGEVIHDFRQGVSGGSNNAPSFYGYFINSIGGRSYERPSDTAKEARDDGKSGNRHHFRLSERLKDTLKSFVRIFI